ncbi:MAG TPA: hypothetical protein VFR81_02845 [Longimicrobium sp.]|nr:hypothetical protein [Longimicrobium sp.]
MILESRGVLRLRVVRDRGQVFVDFGSSVDPGSWLDGSFVLDHVLGSGRSRIDDPPRGISLEAFGELLGTHFERIEKAFRRSTYMDTRSAVRRLSDQWMLRTLGRPIPKDR